MPYRLFSAASFSFLSIARNALSAALLWIVFMPVAGGQNAALESPRGEISGTVLLSGGNRPAAQVVVSFKSRLLGVSRSVLTDYEGRFTVQGLPLGAYEVVAEESGFEPAESKVRLETNLSNVVLRLKQSISTRDLGSNATVSVRQLMIPSKAVEE